MPRTLGPPNGIALLHSAQAVLADLDGCLAASNVALPCAATFAERMRDRLYIVSNNSTEDAATLSRTLAAGGLGVPAERIVLAGETAVAVVAREHPGARVLLAGNATLRGQAEAAGLHLTDERPEVVLLTRDMGFTYETLAHIAAALASGAHLIVSNPDLTHPGLGRRIVPETGALLAAVRAVAPQSAPRVIGKPAPSLYLTALERAGVADPAQAVMIGDNSETDPAGARALGMPAILIGPAPTAQAPDIGALVA